MNYLQYYPIDVVNGEGTRCTLFVSGCSHACKGCYVTKRVGHLGLEYYLIERWKIKLFEIYRIDAFADKD